MKAKSALIAVVASALLGVTLVTPASTAAAATVITPLTLATSPAHVGTHYSATLSFTSGATWSVTSGQLPPGLTLSGPTISGTPTQGGAYTFIVRASAGTVATKKYTILVYLPTATGYETRMSAALTNSDRAPTGSSCDHSDYLTYGIADLWTNHDPADANAKLASVKVTQLGGTGTSCDPSADQAHNNLLLSYLVRPYMLYNSTSSFFPGRLTAAASSNLIAQMWAYASKYSKRSQAANVWNLFDSENHDASADSFNFLAAQAFNDSPTYKTKIYGDGSTVAQQYQAWHDHWSTYFDERAKRGLFIETGAPTYSGYTLQSILNIYDFADDPVLRKKAGMILDLDFADYAQESLHNVWAGAKSRSYPVDSYDGINDNLLNFGNLVFGPALATGGGDHLLMLATSGYSPPPVVQSLAASRATLAPFADVVRRPGNGLVSPDSNDYWHVDPTKSVLDYAYVTPDYVLSTTELHPGDTHIAPSSQNRWQGITFGSGGTGARIYPLAAPPNVTPTNDAFLSVQSQNALITEKQAYLSDATLVYIPAGLTQVVANGAWLFVQEGSAYVAIRPAIGTYSWLNAAKNNAPNIAQRFIQLSVASSPIIFEAARAGAYASFQAFQSRILGNAFSAINGAVNYTSSNGTKLTMFTNPTKTPTINGASPDYAPTNVFNSPYMQSVWGSGKITITFAGHGATYDFSNSAAPVKTVH